MAVRYKKYQNNNKKSAFMGKWYGRAIVMDEISTKDIADEVAHATTVTYTDVIAVLSALASAMKQHLQNSQRVTLDGIGSFQVGITTTRANSSAEFDATKIKGYHIIYRPVRHFNATGVSEKGRRTGFFTTDLLVGISAKEAPKNAVVDARESGGNTEG